MGSELGDEMGPVAPAKQERIAAHRAPTAKDHIRLAVFIVRQMWKTSPALVGAVAFGLSGWVCIVVAVVWGLVELLN